MNWIDPNFRHFRHSIVSISLKTVRNYLIVGEAGDTADEGVMSDGRNCALQRLPAGLAFGRDGMRESL